MGGGRGAWGRGSQPLTCLSSLASSVLESDPEFGFEEAKQQLEGMQTAAFGLLLALCSFDLNSPSSLVSQCCAVALNGGGGEYLKR